MTRLVAHLLLMACLILNGIGSVALATVSPLNHGGMAMSVDAATVDDASPCHQLADAQGETTKDGFPTDHADCCSPERPCDATVCDSLCAQHAIVLLPTVPEVGSEDLAAHYRTIILPGRDDPSLRRPVRPPIPA